jgi:hypothetical protein
VSGFSSGYSSGSGNSSPEKKPAGLKSVETAPSNLLDAPAPIVLETDDMEIGLNKASDSSKGDPDRGQARRSSVMSTVDEEGGQVSMCSLYFIQFLFLLKEGVHRRICSDYCKCVCAFAVFQDFAFPAFWSQERPESRRIRLAGAQKCHSINGDHIV